MSDIPICRLCECVPSESFDLIDIETMYYNCDTSGCPVAESGMMLTPEQWQQLMGGGEPVAEASRRAPGGINWLCDVIPDSGTKLYTHAAPAVAWRYRKPICDDKGVLTGYSEWHYTEKRDFLPWWPHEGTVAEQDSAPAVDGAVLDALESLVKICEAEGFDKALTGRQLVMKQARTIIEKHSRGMK